jgi:hypothetical protein
MRYFVDKITIVGAVQWILLSNIKGIYLEKTIKKVKTTCKSTKTWTRIHPDSE